MNHARFTTILAGMTSVARKAYEAVPIQETWPTSKIIAELQRQGTALPFRTLVGCLRTLCDAGIVVEVSHGMFRRVPVRDPVPTSKASAAPKPIAIPTLQTYTPKEPTMKAAPQPTPATKPSPLDLLGALAARANALGDQLKVLATDLSDAAVEMQAQAESDAGALEKLKQFQALLKSLN